MIPFRFLASLAFSAIYSVLLLCAQPGLQEGKPLDKIIAVVGKEIILLSDVNAQLMLLAQQSPKLDVMDKQIRERVLNAMIGEKLMVAKAMEDSIVVMDEEVDAQLEQQISQMSKQYGSAGRLEQVYGKSIAEIKREGKDEVRKQMLAMRLKQKVAEAVKATPKDVDEFFKMFQDSLPMIPAGYELAHIVKYVKSSETAKQETMKLAMRVRDSIIKSGSFSDFAKRYSQDTYSAKEGGELGWNAKGRFVPEFEKAAYALQPEEISLPIESPFGYHVIQLIEKKTDAINTRHILFKLGQSDEDKKRAIDSLADIKRRAIAGEKFEDLAKYLSDENETRGFGGSLDILQVSQLPDDFKREIEKLQDGEITDPLPYALDPSKPGFHILKRVRFLPEHKATLNTDYKVIQRMSLESKKMRAVEDFITRLRSEMFVEVKE